VLECDAVGADAGIRIGDGVLVNDRLSTSAPNAWATGDIAIHALIAARSRSTGARFATDTPLAELAR